MQLKTSASAKGLCLNLMEAQEFVDLDDSAVGFDFAMEEIFDMVAAFNVNGEQSAELPDEESVVVCVAEEAEEAVSLTDIYKGLLGVEQFWRDNAFEPAFQLTKDV